MTRHAHDAALEREHVGRVARSVSRVEDDHERNGRNRRSARRNRRGVCDDGSTEGVGLQLGGSDFPVLDELATDVGHESSL